MKTSATHYGGEAGSEGSPETNRYCRRAGKKKIDAARMQRLPIVVNNPRLKIP